MTVMQRLESSHRIAEIEAESRDALMHCLAAWRLCSLWPVQTKKSPQGTRARPREPTCPPAISGAMDHLRGSPGRWTISGDHLGGDASAGAVVRGLQEAIGCSAAHATAFLDNAQAPGELDRCVAAAGLRYFEVQRLERLLPWALREAARGREGETVALSTLYPQPQAGQSVAGFLDQHQLSQYASALEAKGLQWGDLPFMSFEVLSAAGLKKFHALRMLRKLPPRPTTHPPPQPHLPPRRICERKPRNLSLPAPKRTICTAHHRRPSSRRQPR
jgi:hypothetical protein